MGANYSGTYATPRLDLGAALMEHQMQAGSLIGTQLFPITPVAKQAATYSAITRESILIQSDAKRGSGGGYNRGDYEAKDKTYSCKEFGLEFKLGDDKRSLYASDFDAELAGTQITMDRLMRAQEIRIATAAFNTSTFTGASLYTDVSANAWDQSADATPVDNVIAAKEIVRKNCGIEPNTMVIGQTTFNNLIKADDIKSRIVNVAMLTEQQIANALAPIFGVRQILVGKGVYNTADEGATMSISDIWSDDYALICVSSMGAGLEMPSIGRTFLWTADSPSNATVEQYREEQTRSDIFRVRHYVDEELIDPYFGHLLKVDA